MASRTSTPRKRGATTSKRRPAAPAQRHGLPGWLWGLAGLVAGFLISQHQHGTAPWQDTPSITPLATVLPKAPSASSEDTEADQAPRMPTFEFYTLLPESEVIAPGGKTTSTATPPPRPANEPEATTADPIAQVIAANQTTDAAPPEAAPAATSSSDADKRFVLQAASFRDAGDARQLAGRLKDFGLLARISEVEATGGATWHRVQVGPYQDRRELNRAQDLMVTQGIEPLLIQLQN